MPPKLSASSSTSTRQSKQPKQPSQPKQPKQSKEDKPKQSKEDKPKKRVTFVETERPCIKPRSPKHKNARIMSFYGSNAGRIASKDTGHTICPAEAPYLGYMDGLYCCLPLEPSTLDKYKYWTSLLESIQAEEPTKDELDSWSTWSGTPSSDEEMSLLRETCRDRNCDRLSKKDSRWRMQQFAPKGKIHDLKRYIINEKNSTARELPCHALKQRDCSTDRCEWLSQADMCLSKPAELRKKTHQSIWV
jgi:hypothetical protein